jgi:predicted CoA-binding protein
VKENFQNPEAIKKILRQYKTVAVVGLSDKADRPSFRVAAYLQRQGYRVIPVNPKIGAILGEKAYPDLQSVPGKIDVVDIFRRSEDVGPIVEEAIKVGARAVWMQEGVVNDEAARKASAAGLEVVMDRCMMKDHERLPS